MLRTGIVLARQRKEGRKAEFEYKCIDIRVSTPQDMSLPLYLYQCKTREDIGDPQLMLMMVD